MKTIKNFFSDASLRKALAWRVVASSETCFLGYICTGSMSIGLSIMSIEMFSKVFLFYVFEKAWNNGPSILQKLVAARKDKVSHVA